MINNLIHFLRRYLRVKMSESVAIAGHFRQCENGKFTINNIEFSQFLSDIFVFGRSAAGQARQNMLSDMKHAFQCLAKIELRESEIIFIGGTKPVKLHGT